MGSYDPPTADTIGSAAAAKRRERGGGRPPRRGRAAPPRGSRTSRARSGPERGEGQGLDANTSSRGLDARSVPPGPRPYGTTWGAPHEWEESSPLETWRRAGVADPQSAAPGSDDAIADAARAELARGGEHLASIEVEVRDGIALLSGHAPDRRSVKSAREIVARIEGVIDVRGRPRVVLEEATRPLPPRHPSARPPH